MNTYERAKQIKARAHLFAGLIGAVVLIAVAVVALFIYRQISINRDNQQRAESIYLAMQSALAHDQSSGQLDAKAKLIKAGLLQDGEVRSTIVPSSYIDGGLPEEADESAYYSLMIHKGDSVKEEQSAAAFLYDLLESYESWPDVSEDGRFEASICIEFDPDSAVVYDVFYSENHDRLTYGEEGNVSIRDDKQLSDDQIGHFGYDTTEKETNLPSIASLTLTNGETLSLSWTLDDPNRIETQSQYVVIQLYNTDDEQLLEIKPKKAFEVRQADGSNSHSLKMTCQVTKTATQETWVYTFPAYIDKDNHKVVMILDAVDIGGTLPKMAGIFRFGLPSSDVYVRARVSSGGEVTAWKESEPVNLYFDSQNGQTYEISNARHLYNIRYVLSKHDRESQIRQIKDISWSELIQQEALYRDGTAVTENTVFPPIQQISAGSSYSAASADGSYRLLDINLQKSDSEDTGLGLFCTNYGTIDHVILEQAAVNSDGMYVGSICGKNSGTITNVSILTPKVSGSIAVGGLVGYNSGTINSCKVSGGSVAGQIFVGGYAGVNTNTSLSGEPLEAMPDQVTGASFTGGLMGASMIIAGDQDVAVSYHINSDVLTVSSSMIGAGAVAGYQKMVPVSEEELQQQIAECGRTLTQAADIDAAITAIQPIDHLPTQGRLMVINSELKTSIISSQVYASGTAGYADPNIIMILQNINQTGVIIASSQWNGYGFAGSVIGRVTPGMTLDQCTMHSSVKTGGMYGGGLTEYNEGTIQNCSVAEFSNDVQDIAGGLAGLNLGTITSCVVDGIVTGKANIGGLAGENGGTITDMTATSKAKVVTLEGDIRGFVGINAGIVSQDTIQVGAQIVPLPVEPVPAPPLPNDNQPHTEEQTIIITQNTPDTL